MKYMKELESQLSSYKHPIFRSYELQSFNISKNYKKRLTHLLLSNGRIKRITRGVYTFHDDINVVGFAFSPFYYGLENALTMHGISTQGTNPIVITPRNVRQGLRVFEGRNYLIKRIPEALFFGYEMVKRGNFWVPVSDLEKTVIDMMYFDGYIRDELWPTILKELQMRRLNEYLGRYKKEFRTKMLKTIKEEKNKAA
jgi:predicted transcriptional regulator of viral defense system